MSSCHPSTPLLPPEIIDEILRNEELEEGDLASCCLVNRSWIDSARKSLYSHVSVRVGRLSDHRRHTSIPTDPLITEDPHYLDLRTSQLHVTLQSRSSLCQLVKHIEFEDFDRLFEGAGPDSDAERAQTSVSMDPREVVVTFAQLCPRTTSLRIGSVGRYCS